MTQCPACKAKNIEGVDVCAQCGQPMGDLALRTPTNRIEKSLVEDSVSALRPQAPIVVQHDQPVSTVLKFMLDKKIGCVFITQDNKIVGVFTERDALNRINAAIDAHKDKPISEFMTPDPKSLGSDANLAFAVRMMDQGGYRHILILDGEGNPEGVTSVRDILGFVAERMT